MRRLAPAALVACLLLVGPVHAGPDEPPPSLEQLAAAFRAATGPARAQALAGLAQHRTAACARLLDEVRRTDADPSIRLQALRLLGTVGADPARAILEEVLERGDRTQRPTALDALALLRPPVPAERFMAALAPTEDPALRLTAARALGRYAQVDVARRLAQVLGEAPLDDALRAAAREALRALVAREPVDAWLVDEALAPRSPLAAAWTDLLRVAPACPHAGLRDALRAHLASRAPHVRAGAADALGELDAGQAAAALATLDALAPLLRDDDPDVVLSAGLAVTRIGPVGAAFDRVLALCRSKSPGLRAIGVGALASCKGERRAVRAAADAIDDATLPVRAAAVATLRALGGKDAVTALVTGLKKNAEGRLQAEILEALVQLTGARPGDDHAAWSRWWSLVKADFDLPGADALAERPRPRTGDAREAAGSSQTRAAPTYYGSEVVSRRLAFVVDVSGSMAARVPGESPEQPGPTRLEVCQRELSQVLEGLADGTVYNLIPFDNAASPWRERALPLGRADRAAALAVIRGLKPGGGTNIYDPLELALLDPAVDTVYLLSDGAPGSGKFVRPDDILREVQKLNAVRRVAIHTISIGVDSDLMRRLAEENGGQAIVVR